jgi:hypothetical protein
MTERKEMVLTQMDIPPNKTQGDKEPVMLMCRYWFGRGNTTYIETIGSDGKSYGFEEEK